MSIPQDMVFTAPLEVWQFEARFGARPTMRGPGWDQQIGFEFLWNQPPGLARCSLAVGYTLQKNNHYDINMISTRFLFSELRMADVAVRGMSPALHSALKKAAEQSHRSLNGEILARLEASLEPATVEVDVLLGRIQARKDRLGLGKLDEDELRGLKQAGRP